MASKDKRAAEHVAFPRCGSTAKAKPFSLCYRRNGAKMGAYMQCRFLPLPQHVCRSFGSILIVHLCGYKRFMHLSKWNRTLMDPPGPFMLHVSRSLAIGLPTQLSDSWLPLVTYHVADLAAHLLTYLLSLSAQMIYGIRCSSLHRTSSSQGQGRRETHAPMLMYKYGSWGTCKICKSVLLAT